MKLKALTLLALGLTGCNVLNVGSPTTTAGTTVNVPLVLELDPGIKAGGVQIDLIITPPLAFTGCTRTAVTDSLSNTDGVGTTKRIVALAADILNGWTNSNHIYNCSVNVPAGTQPGTYPITFAKAKLAENMPGRELPLIVKKGAVHVIP